VNPNPGRRFSASITRDEMARLRLAAAAAVV
jgi:hypothetical protein